MTNFNPIFEDTPTIDWKYPYTIAPLIFTSNDEKLIGTVFITAGAGPHPTVLLLHGFPGNELNYDIAHTLRRFGFNVVLFHYRGAWGSSGNFTFSNGLEDVSNAIHFIKSDIAYKNLSIDKKKIILIGHSFGGFAALLNSAEHNDIKNVASLAGFNFGYFSRFTQQDKSIEDATMEGLTLGSQLLNNADPHFLYDEMIKNQDEWDLLNLDKELKGKNILLVGAEYDSVSPLQIHHTPLVEKLRATENEITDVVIKSEHSFSCCRIRLNEVIFNWIKNIKF
ncbi:MAG: alpha/beta hydrolase [Chlorobi bacterium]|nr:alpha/beta hydrolase [Chlorobiota bacterium]